MNYSAPTFTKLSKANNNLKTTSKCNKYCPDKYKDKKGICKKGYCTGSYIYKINKNK